MSTKSVDLDAVLGRTGLRISRICVGTAAWGVASPIHGLAVPEEQAIATARRTLEGPLTILDTSNNYGDGESERRIGLALREAGGPPDGFVVQTKLDRDPDTGSFDRARMRSSLEESLTRLGLSKVPVLYLHDPEHIGFEPAMAGDGPVQALLDLRDEGYADFIGISGGPASMMARFVRTGLFDALITHNRYTLVDRTADALISEAVGLGIGVVNAAVYGGGILSSWPRRSGHYHYAPAAPDLLAAIDAMGAACAEVGVPLIAAALQFSLRDRRIASTICGMVSPEQVDHTLALSALPIPDELWTRLDELCPPRSSWIDD